MILKNFSDLICMELETVLFSFEVSPIKKKDYICFAIQSNGRKYFLLGGMFKSFCSSFQTTIPSNG